MNVRRYSSRVLLVCGFLLTILWLSLGLTGCSRRHDLPGTASPLPDRACFALGQKDLLGFMDTAGQLVTKPTYVMCEMDGWYEGHLWVMTGDYGSYTGTFIRGDGTPISPPRFGVLQILSPGLNNPGFINGLATVVLEGGVSAVIDTTGTVLCEGWWPYSDDNGLIQVSKGGKYGYADIRGNLVIPHQFDQADAFFQGMAQVRIDGKHRVIRRDGAFVGGEGYEFVKAASRSKRTFWVGVNGRTGLADERGRLLIEALFDEILEQYTPDHICFVREADSLWALLDKGGTILTPPSFTKVEKFPWRSHYTKVTGEDGGVGLIDIAGVLHAPCRFEDVKAFVPGKTFVRKDKKWGLANKAGDFLLEPQFNAVRVQGERHALVCVLEKEYRSQLFEGEIVQKWGVVASGGRVVVPPTFSDIRSQDSPHHDLVKVWHKKKCGLLNVQSLTEVLPVAYDLVYPWGNDLYAVWNGKHFGLVNTAGEWRIALSSMVESLPVTVSGKYVEFVNSAGEWHLAFASMVESLPDILQNGYGVIRTESGVGLISVNGEIVLPCEYEDVGFFSEGLVPAKQGGVWGYVNVGGEWIVPPQYEEAAAFRDGFAAVRRDGKVGLIDKRGKMCVPFRYADAGYVLGDRFPFALEREGKQQWGIADLAGKIILPPEYDCVEWIDLEPGKTRYHVKPGWREF